MTPQKTPKRRNQHHHHSNSQNYSQAIPVLASDYDSEAFVPRPAEQRSNEQINLSVLQRYVPSIQSILSIAASTQIYTFSSETTSWDRANIDGPLFVCQLAASPMAGDAQYCIVVLNKRSLENLIIETKDIKNVEITEQFLLITLMSQGEMKTLGLYIHESTADVKMVNFQKIKDCWEATMSSIAEIAELIEKYGMKECGGDSGQQVFNEGEVPPHMLVCIFSESLCPDFNVSRVMRH
jgi:hypothetical protein